MGTTAEQVGSAEDVTNLTGDQSAAFQGQAGAWSGKMEDTYSSLSEFSVDVPTAQARTGTAKTGDAVTGSAMTGNVKTAKGMQYDPMSGYRAFFGMQPQLQGLISGATSDYARGQFQMAETQANKAREQTWGELAAAGLVEGGQTGRSLYEADFESRQQALNNVTGMQTQMYGQLANTMLGTLPGQYQAQAQMTNELGMFNVGQQNQMSQFNVGQQNQMSQFNVGQQNQMSQFNVGQQNRMTQFNVGQQNQMGMFNAQQQMAAQQMELDALVGAGNLAAGGYQGALSGYAASQNFYEPNYEATNWATDFALPLIGAGAGAAATMAGGGYGA